MIKEVLKKIDNKKLNVGIVGLGYVGLPLAVEFARAGFKVFGVDMNKAKVNKINKGINYIPDGDTSSFKNIVKNSQWLIDTRNATKGIKSQRIVKL